MKKSMIQAAGIFAIAAVLILGGCSGKKDAKSIYEDAVKKTAEMSSADFTSDMTISMIQDEQTIDIDMQMDSQMDGINTDNMHYVSNMTMSAMGQNMDMTVFYTDGYFYTELMGQRIKYAMALEEMTKQVHSATGGTLASSMLKDIKAEKDGDFQKLTFTADPAKMDEYMQTVMGSLTNTMGSMADVEMKISEGSGSMTVSKEGYIAEQNIKMKLETTANGSTAKMDMDVHVVYNNPGQEITVEIPDTEGYQEVDPSMLGL